MHSITASNVNTAFSSGLHWLRVSGSKETSRVGDVLVSPTPVCTTYKNPDQRVLFSPLRDANPFFHFMEGLWMLAGRQDLDFVKHFNKGMERYSDDGHTLNGAYGWRWRNTFGYDQLYEVVELLRREPNTRRAVLTMWDAYDDLMNGGEYLDVPCNTHIYFDCRGGKLNMTVCCRSNDAIWGAYGANAVHMSMMMEVVAAGVGAPMGDYRQISNNFHAYYDMPNIVLESCLESPSSVDLYRTLGLQTFPMVNGTDYSYWIEQCEAFCHDPLGFHTELGTVDPFFTGVAQPMYQAWETRKTGQGNGLIEASAIEADDWRIACEEWILRREAAKQS